MGSILQNIETTISTMDDKILDAESMEYLVCYLGYCMDAHLKDTIHTGYFTVAVASFIELPANIIDRLIRAGYVSTNETMQKPVLRRSAYFYYPGIMGENNSQIYNYQFAYILSETVRCAFVEFCERPLDERARRIENFLKHIRDFINQIHINYLNQLAKCC